VRTTRWKFIHYFVAPDEFELYDLQNDPNEDRNIYGKPGYEKITEYLKQRLIALRQETGDHYVWHASRVPEFTVKISPPPQGLHEMPLH
jgi:hypothetical protein